MFTVYDTAPVPSVQLPCSVSRCVYIVTSLSPAPASLAARVCSTTELSATPGFRMGCGGFSRSFSSALLLPSSFCNYSINNIDTVVRSPTVAQQSLCVALALMTAEMVRIRRKADTRPTLRMT